MCAFGLAAVLVSAVGPPSQEPTAEAARHEDRPKGEVWVAASVDSTATTWEWEHVNLWNCAALICDNTAGVGTEAGGRRNDKTTIPSCRPRTGTERAAYSEGCRGHDAGDSGWDFVGHVMCLIGDVMVHHNETGWETRCAASGAVKRTGAQVADSALYSCPGVGAVSDPAHCGEWSECTGNEVPNEAKTACTPCGANERPSTDGETCEIQDCPDTADGQSQHRHGTGACEADHPARNGPDCDPSLTSDVTVTWTYHDASGDNATGSKVCGPIGDGGGGGGGSSAAQRRCARNSREYPFGKYWGYRQLFRTGASEVVGSERVSTPMPHQRGGNRWPWQPAVRPASGLAAEPGGGLAVEIWRSDYTAADRPAGWAQFRAAHIGAATTGIWEQGLEGTTSGGQAVWAACGEVRVQAAGSGWRLTNLTLDGGGATSGTGLGRFSWQGVRAADPSKPAGVAAWQAWTITAVVYENTGEPWPSCHRLRIIWRAETAAGGYAAGSRPAGAASARACQWTVKIWRAVPVEVTACAGTPAHDHDPDPGGDEPFGAGDTIKGPHRHCAYAGV